MSRFSWEPRRNRLFYQMRTRITVDDFRFAGMKPPFKGPAKRLLQRDVIDHQIGLNLCETCFGIQEVALGIQHVNEALASPQIA